jgi:hypothetical protein
MGKPSYGQLLIRLFLVLFIFSTTIWISSGETSLAAPLASPAATDGYIPKFYYIFVAGSSLHSADYTMRQDYQPGACVSAVDTGGQFFTLNLNLPDGARIDYLRLFYNDTDASNGTANLRKYDGAGGYTEIATVSSTGNAGFGTTLSAYIGHVVNNIDGGYVLNWQPIVTGTSMQLCGLRVAYRLPAKEFFMPFVIR